jgi:hypothetical protein
MIDAGIGQVRCPECNQIYAVSEIVTETSGMGSQVCCSTVWKFLKCPENHVLMNYEYMRFFFGHSRKDSAHESTVKKSLIIPKFTAGLD